MLRDHSPPARRDHRGRSGSPPSRSYETQGGGRSSSRQRSPGFYANDNGPSRRGQDNGYGGRGGRGRSRDDGYGSRPRDNGYGDRDRVRSNDQADDGYPGRGGSSRGGRGGGRDRGDREEYHEWGGGPGAKRRRGDEEYTDKDRERERDVDRKKYDGDVKKESSVEPEKPNFGVSGLLAKETNTVQGVELKYNEPPEARKPLKNWRLYVFKGTEQLDLIHIYKQSAYLVGRDPVVTDIPIAHPSCSKQHAAIQYRQISEKNEFGDVTTSVKPFIIDLDSTNGTHVNDQEIPKSRYYELRNSDVIKFGTSSREYVLLHEDATV